MLYMGSKIKYTPLDEDTKKIEALVKKQRFRNHDAFLDRAIQILLTWELDPKSSMDIMKGYPQTDEQKQILEQCFSQMCIKNILSHQKNNQLMKNQD